jgi:putative thioredoxin
MLTQAQTLMAEGNFLNACDLLKTAYQQSKQRPDIGCHLAHCLAETGKLDEAEAILSSIAMVDQDQYFAQIKALIELKREASDTPEIRALQQQLLDTPDDLTIKHQLAIQLSQADRQEEALELLHNILQIDKEFADNSARRAYLDILKTLGPKDPIAINFQRKLYSLLY